MHTRPECLLAVNCAVPPFPPPTSPPIPAPIPTDWQATHACAQDTAGRILRNDNIATLTDNTPADCIARCTSLSYCYAGVEFGDECHCGTGYVGTPTDTNVTDCSIRCTGDEDYTCGGSWCIQLYEGPVPVEQFPPGFESAWGPCAFDSPARDFLDDQITLLSNNTPATCAWFCYNGGFTFAGVENGNECHCSTGLNGGPPIQAPNCVTPCPGNNELICGGPWGLEIWTQS